MWLIRKIAVLRNGDAIKCSELYASDFDKAYSYLKQVSPSIDLKEENVGFSISYDGLFGAGSLCEAQECTYKCYIYQVQNVDEFLDDI